MSDREKFEAARRRLAAEQAANLPFLVRYFDEKLSHQGRGVQCRRFATVPEAEDFAGGRVLYGRPAKVERGASS